MDPEFPRSPGMTRFFVRPANRRPVKWCGCHSAQALRPRPVSCNVAGHSFGPAAMPGAASARRLDNHEGHGRTFHAAQVAWPRASRGRAPQHDSDPVERPAAGGRRSPEAHGDRPRHRGGRTHASAEVTERRHHAPCPPTPSTTSCASCPTAPQVVARDDRRRRGCRFRAGRSRFTLPTLPAERFPGRSPPASWRHRFEVRPADLTRLIDKTRFAISTEETRYYLNGIYLHARRADGAPGAARRRDRRAPAGARGRRAPTGPVGMPGVIVPRKAVAEIAELLDDARERGRGRACRRLEDPLHARPSAVLTSKLIDGTFPDYQRVIPTGNDKRLAVDKGDFAAAVDRVSTISSERGRAVKLSLADGRLRSAVTNPDSGSADRGDGGRLRGAPRSISASTPAISSTSRQQIDGDTALFELADPARRP